MMFIDELYQQTVADNEKSLRFWEDYLNSLKSLDFNVYAEKLKVPILVPVGSRIFFRGALKHTNEVTVSLGADYFVKCSLKQAEVLRQHRIKDAQEKLDAFIKEKEYLENHLSFAKQNVYDKQGQEIIEHYTVQEDEAWRKIHRENVRKHKQREAKEKQIQPNDVIADEELWERLEELELQEELENEMLDNYNEIVDKRKENSFIVNEQNLLLNSFKEEAKQSVYKTNLEETENDINKSEENTIDNKNNITNETKSSKVDLLQQVLDKQNALESKLHELKYREREQSKTEQDLISKLDELEQLDDLEDEIDRLDNILETNVESDENSDQSDSISKKILFADEDDSETVEIPFTHSDIEPSNEGYNPEKGITKPSDIYECYSHLFHKKPTSILKKTKCDQSQNKKSKKTKKQIEFQEPEDNNSKTDVPCTSVPVKDEDEEAPRMIVINDVVEKPADTQKKIELGARPTSLFKQRRLQQNKARFA